MNDIKDKLEKVGCRILSERKVLGMSQDELINALRDKQIAISRSSLYKIEHGERCDSFTIPLLLALCDIFGCEMGYLMNEQGYENKTRTTTDIVQATGLAPEAVQQLKAWNTPAKLSGTFPAVEKEIHLKAHLNSLKVVSQIINDRALINALVGYLYPDEKHKYIYVKGDNGSHYNRNPTFIAINGVQVTPSLIEQSLLNTITDELKAFRKETRNA